MSNLYDLLYDRELLRAKYQLFGLTQKTFRVKIDKLRSMQIK